MNAPHAKPWLEGPGESIGHILAIKSHRRPNGYLSYIFELDDHLIGVSDWFIEGVREQLGLAFDVDINEAIGKAVLVTATRIELKHKTRLGKANHYTVYSFRLTIGF